MDKVRGGVIWEVDRGRDIRACVRSCRELLSLRAAFCIKPGADIDALLVCPRNIERKDFFDSFGSLLAALPEVKDLRVSVGEG